MPTLPLPTPPKEHHPFASLKKLANSTLPNDIALTAIIETLAEKTNVESVVCLESILMEEGGLDEHKETAALHLLDIMFHTQETYHRQILLAALNIISNILKTSNNTQKCTMINIQTQTAKKRHALHIAEALLAKEKNAKALGPQNNCIKQILQLITHRNEANKIRKLALHVLTKILQKAQEQMPANHTNPYTLMLSAHIIENTKTLVPHTTALQESTADTQGGKDDMQSATRSLLLVSTLLPYLSAKTVQKIHKRLLEDLDNPDHVTLQILQYTFRNVSFELVQGHLNPEIDPSLHLAALQNDPAKYLAVNPNPKKEHILKLQGAPLHLFFEYIKDPSCIAPFINDPSQVVAYSGQLLAFVKAGSSETIRAITTLVSENPDSCLLQIKADWIGVLSKLDNPHAADCLCGWVHVGDSEQYMRNLCTSMINEDLESPESIQRAAEKLQMLPKLPKPHAELQSLLLENIGCKIQVLQKRSYKAIQSFLDVFDQDVLEARLAEEEVTENLLPGSLYGRLSVVRHFPNETFLPEIVLALKEPSSDVRELAKDILISLPLEKTLEMVLACLGGETKEMRNASLTALTFLLFELKHQWTEDMVDNVFEVVEVLKGEAAPFAKEVVRGGWMEKIMNGRERAVKIFEMSGLERGGLGRDGIERIGRQITFEALEDLVKPDNKKVIIAIKRARTQDKKKRKERKQNAPGNADSDSDSNADENELVARFRAVDTQSGPSDLLSNDPQVAPKKRKHRDDDVVTLNEQGKLVFESEKPRTKTKVEPSTETPARPSKMNKHKETKAKVFRKDSKKAEDKLRKSAKGGKDSKLEPYAYIALQSTNKSSGQRSSNAFKGIVGKSKKRS